MELFIDGKRHTCYLLYAMRFGMEIHEVCVIVSRIFFLVGKWVCMSDILYRQDIGIFILFGFISLVNILVMVDQSLFTFFAA